MLQSGEAGVPLRARPTMADVARHAGVALKTVSRFVNQESGVSPAMADRVAAAISDLGYRRNEGAASLRRGSTFTIGLVVESFTDPFSSAIAQVVEEVTHDRGMLLLAATTRRTAAREEHVTSALCARRVDGLVLLPAAGADHSYLQAEISAGLNLVLAGRPSEVLVVDQVLPDYRRAAKAAVAHLSHHGHQDIALINEDDDPLVTREHMRGYRAGLKACGIAASASLTSAVRPAEQDVATALNAAVRAGATAVITGSSTLTTLLLESCGGVPALGLIGLGDLDPGRLSGLDVTVVGHDGALVGRRATELLWDRMSGDASPPRQELVEGRLVVRGSGERPPR